MSFKSTAWIALDDVVEEIIDRRGVTPLKLGGDFVTEGHRVISAKLLKERTVQLDADEARYVSSEIYKKWMKLPLRAGDVIMTSEAPLGELAYLHEDKDWVLGQRLFAIRPRKELMNGRFLYYVLQTNAVRSDIQGRATGTTVQGIRQAELRLVKVPVPSLAEQNEAASFLGAIDDRITLLRETNKTLEAIAQAIFKSWFIDFDPVRAKMEGRAPAGMDEETAALFPDELVESELGFVPTGWKVGMVGDLMTLNKGSVNPLKQPNTFFQHFSLPAFDNGQMPSIDLGSEIKSNKTRIDSRCVLLSKLNPHIPRIWLPSSVEQNAVCSTEFLPLMSKLTTSTSFIYTFLSSESFVASLGQYVTGTSNSHQRIQPDVLLGQKSIVPCVEVLEAFESITNPLYEKVKASRDLVYTLSRIRNTLLPRLISGKLRIQDTELEAQT